MGSSLRTRIARIVIATSALSSGLAVFAASIVIRGRIDLVAALVWGAGAATLGAVLALPFGMLLARRSTAPLEQLAQSAAAFATGVRARRMDTRGPMEVRRVAEAFNMMADAVEAAVAELSSEERRKTQFVSDVSHELRTPLTAIRGAAETLLDGEVDAEHQERFLTTIAREAERLTRLANDLLALQRIEGATGELPFRRVDLAEAARRAVTMLEPLIEDRGIEVSVRGAAPLVLGEMDRLQQVVANLVDNASRIVGEGGHVWIELSGEPGWALLSVCDDGPGIPADDIERLFDRFYRADSSRARTSGGSGLGLAIVRAIVTSHGGTVAASNVEGSGACLIVRLPALPL